MFVIQLKSNHGQAHYLGEGARGWAVVKSPRRARRFAVREVAEKVTREVYVPGFDMVITHVA